ncbi:hypothetical protein TraAM80_08102 [Trypanosoma rangeli]|uniref:Amastin surface glycoprotein n=1 Tax=Trypanosoma rangeli TaxID=5698 RepID=A0A3R7KFR8_TRYRA|nr:uncharacterized protein TraAM80_08102 [Trypanosoma rangeli]RNE99568.1 hypothetical protein TraAM80_08102 [Trypanosoma rangeli]|eukprot:RNE99568.1 hypothetical protein TraAM80_08102 [Trypanosoma rangeli]
MFCCPSLRILVLIMAVLATACAVCANIFPVFQKKSDTVTMKQTLWYSRTILPGGNETEHKVSKSLCQQYKLFFQASEAMIMGAIGVGLIVMVFVIVQMICGSLSCCLGCLTSLLITIASAASGVCVALLVYGYMKGYCQDDTALSSIYAPFKDQNYKFAESFYLICVACGLFFLSRFFQCWV